MEKRNEMVNVKSSFDLEKVIRANKDELGINLQCQDEQLRDLLIITRLQIKNWVNSNFIGIYRLEGAEEALRVLQSCIESIATGFSDKNSDDCSEGFFSAVRTIQFLISYMDQELKIILSNRKSNNPNTNSSDSKEVHNGR